jgi:hypothetical protein
MHVSRKTKKKLAFIPALLFVLLMVLPSGTVFAEWTGGHCVIGANAGSQTWYFAEGCTRSGFNEWLCLQNPNAGPTSATVTYMFSDQAAKNVSYTIPGLSRKTINVCAELSSEADVSLKITSNDPIIAERPMYFNYHGEWTGGHDAIGATTLVGEYYFAEGTTREGFDEWLTIQNPNTSGINVHTTYMPGPNQGSIIEKDYTIGANKRYTVFVPDAVGRDKDISIHLTSTSQFLAERPMYFNYNGVWNGGHVAIGATATSTQLYFAEGYTGPGFDEYICVLNPGDETATLKFFFQTQEAGEKQLAGTVAPKSRQTFKVNDLLGPNYQTSLRIESDQAVVAERPMYFDYSGWTGGHDVTGIPSPQTTFYFAEGYTGEGFDEWLCLMNPGTSETTAHVTYMFTNGTTQKRDVNIGKQSRTTVKVNDIVGAGKDVSILVESGLPIVAERPMYFDYSPWSPPPPVTPDTPDVVNPDPVDPNPTPDTTTVYITETGTKYHRDGCRYLSKSKIPISLSDAKARGYTPCSVCNPPV